MADPTGRFLIAFNQPTLKPNPTWTRIDSHESLVTSYQIDRGRQYELDRTDTGRATVSIADKDGILDPTNTSGPYYFSGNGIRPLLQACIGRRNPMSGIWYTRYRGFIEDFDYTFDPSQVVNRLDIGLVDLFEILSAVEMYPGEFGHTPPTTPVDFRGQVYFGPTGAGERVDDRIRAVLGSPTIPSGARIPAAFYVVFSGNVNVMEDVHSAGESAMVPILQAADAEFPGVSNVYCDRFGRLCFHGRQAKFDPVGVASGTTPDVWEFHQWRVGDQTAQLVDPPMARIHRFAFNRGLSKIINKGYATPFRRGTDLTATEKANQIYTAASSIDDYGIRTWSAQDLITLGHVLPHTTTDLEETKKFAQYYVNNYRLPANRVTDIALRSTAVAVAGAGETWDVLSRVDIADSVSVSVGSPGGGGFGNALYFVEGIHETVQPLNATMDDVTLTLDLSPQAYFSDLSMFPYG